MTLPITRTDREFNRFTEVNGKVSVNTNIVQELHDSVKTEPPTLYKIVRVQNSVITYIGENKTQGELLATSTWRVRRISINGIFTTTIFADDGNFTQPFDDPESLFPTPVLSNIYSTDFDGINDVCNGGNIHNYDMSNQFSINLYIKPDNLSAQRCLFSKATNDANVYGYVLSHDSSGKLLLQMRAPGKLRLHTFATTLTTAWQMITLTFNGNGDLDGARCYINGVVEDTPASNSLGGWLSGQDFTVGARDLTQPFSGKIDSMTVWNTNLSAPQVTELYNSGVVLNPTVHSASANLVSWYRMGDGDLFPTISDNQGVFNLTMTNMTSDDFVTDVP